MELSLVNLLGMDKSFVENINQSDLKKLKMSVDIVCRFCGKNDEALTYILEQCSPHVRSEIIILLGLGVCLTLKTKPKHLEIS